MYALEVDVSRERQQAVAERKSKTYPWHSPPHRYLLGKPANTCCPPPASTTNPPSLIRPSDWITLPRNFFKPPNNFPTRFMPGAFFRIDYRQHCAAKLPDLEPLLAAIGQLHGRIHAWNAEEKPKAGRTGLACVDRKCSSHRHRMASINAAARSHEPRMERVPKAGRTGLAAWIGKCVRIVIAWPVLTMFTTIRCGTGMWSIGWIGRGRVRGDTLRRLAGNRLPLFGANIRS